MVDLLRRARTILREDGILPLLRAVYAFWYRTVVTVLYTTLFLRPVYRLKHGHLAPQPAEQLCINPSALDYSIARRHIPPGAPPYGILDGSWDLQKTPWRQSIWDGLRERFDEGKRWEETVYYQDAVDKLSRRPLKRAENAQTLAEFERYLESLDQLYEDISSNGYDPSSVITASIGRNGEWMTNHGNHRRTIAVVADVDAVPVEIKYRHKRWQSLRRNIYNADSVEDLNETQKNHLSHPDVRSFRPSDG